MLFPPQASQSFTNDSASAAGVIGGSSGPQAGIVLSGSTTARVVTVSYDAPSQSYTIVGQPGTLTFAPADLQSTTTVQTIYQKSTASTLDRLTLVEDLPTWPKAPLYVALGFLQHNALDTSNNLVVNIDVFTYGMDTPASGVPRTGQAAFDTNLFAIGTITGGDPLEMIGSGRFDVDLGLGRFTTSGAMTASNLATGVASSNSFTLSGGGSLSSTDGTFSGFASATSALTLPATGALSGRFYGPNGQELGAAFSLTDSGGTVAISGALVGTSNTTTAPAVLSLANLPSGDHGLGAEEVDNVFSSGTSSIAATTPTTGSLTVNTNGNLQVAPDNVTAIFFTPADQVAGAAANFTRYQTTVGNLRTLDLYNGPSTNTELALTYSSFGYWTAIQGGTTTQSWLTYGAATPAGYVQARTGTATYSGVAYGTASAGTPSNPTQTALSGRSNYSVDFGHQTYVLSMNLGSTGPTSTDFGSYVIGGQIGRGNTAFIDGPYAGNINTQFYGPAADEVGSVFSGLLSSGPHSGAAINGVAAAKKP